MANVGIYRRYDIYLTQARSSLPKTALPSGVFMPYDFYTISSPRPKGAILLGSPAIILCRNAMSYSRYDHHLLPSELSLERKA